MGVAHDRYLPGRNAMLANEAYVIKHKHDFFDLPIRITEI